MFDHTVKSIDLEQKYNGQINFEVSDGDGSKNGFPGNLYLEDLFLEDLFFLLLNQ